MRLICGKCFFERREVLKNCVNCCWLLRWLYLSVVWHCGESFSGIMGEVLRLSSAMASIVLATVISVTVMTMMTMTAMTMINDSNNNDDNDSNNNDINYTSNTTTSNKHAIPEPQ